MGGKLCDSEFQKLRNGAGDDGASDTWAGWGKGGRGGSENCWADASDAQNMSWGDGG